MNPLILAVILAVMQVAPPVPRKAVNSPPGGGHDTPSNGAAGQQPAGQSTPPFQPNETPSANKTAEQRGTNNKERSVGISKLPPVSVTRNWADWGYWAFSGFLLIVGFLQVWLLFGNLRAIERQAGIMQRQTDAVEKTVDITIAKERARVQIWLEQNRPQAQPSSGPVVANVAICFLKNYGLTPAFPKDFAMRYLRTDDADLIVDYEKGRRILLQDAVTAGGTSARYGIPLEPTPGLSQTDMQRIRDGESFLHIYGFVRYQDISGKSRRTTIHVRWTERWGIVVSGQVTEYWEPVGPPEENDET